MSASITFKKVRASVFALAAVTAALAVPVGTVEAKSKKHFSIVFDLGGGAYHGRYWKPYEGSCRWLKRRAIRTDSAYWWSRYHSCIYG